MSNTFNPQILTEKLAKLNSSQQSIETLSHWCIFHMNKAKFVVDTWASQFHCSPRDQRISFLYLANDILQNSRRKGVDFVTEFWRVLPEALRDVILNGDDAGKKAARRLISIWDERKVFGARGHILKDDILSRQSENSNKSERQPNHKPRQSAGNVLNKVVSDYDMLCGGELNEDALLSKCTSSISNLENMVRDFSSGLNPLNPGKFSNKRYAEELQGQHAILKECIEQLTALESSRASLVSHVRDFLQEQEFKLDRVRSQLQAAQLQSVQVTNVCGLPNNSNNIHLDEEASSVPPGFTPAPTVMYTRQVSLPEHNASFDDAARRSAVADMAAKLSASTSSAEMLSSALTSLVNEVPFANGNNGNSRRDHLESSANWQLEKRHKIENGSSFYSSPPLILPSPPPLDQLPPPPPPPPPYSALDHMMPGEQPPPPPPYSALDHMMPGEQPPPPPSSPPPLPPMPPMMLPYPMPPQFIQTAGTMPNMGYNYGPPQPVGGSGYPSMGPPMTGMSPYGHPVHPYQNYQVSEGGFYHPSSAPMPHQQSL